MKMKAAGKSGEVKTWFQPTVGHQLGLNNSSFEKNPLILKSRSDSYRERPSNVDIDAEMILIFYSILSK